MANDVRSCDRHQCGKENWGDLECLNAPTVKVKSDESDRHVQQLPGNLMAVDEVSVASM